MSLKVRNWPRFQHYKHRRPPWIKLHREILDNRDFMCLPLASMALAPCLWLLASESDGTLTSDIEELTFRLRREAAVVVEAVNALIDNGFLEGEKLSLQSASEPLAERPQHATTETEKSRVETEKENGKSVGPPADAYSSASQTTAAFAAREVFEYWVQATATRRSSGTKPKWGSERKRILERRLKEESGTLEERIAGLKLAVDGALADPFYNGTETGRTYLGFDNIFRNKGRDRIEKLQEVGRRAKPAPPARKLGKPLPAEDSTAAQKWEEVKAAMSGMIPAHLYRTWFSPTFGWGWALDEKHPENGYPVLVVTVPSPQHRETLHAVYSKQLKILLKDRDVNLLQLHVKAFE